MMLYMVKLWGGDKLTIQKEDFDKLTEGLFIDCFRGISRSGSGHMIIPLKNIQLWYSVDTSTFINQDLKPRKNVASFDKKGGE